jgi:AraC-like DNA-binding protein
LHQNFFQFVNSYRVEEAKKLLRDPASSHINIAEIGFRAGFSSAASFNALFKKFTHTTPSQYQKQFAHRDTTAKF